MDSKFVLVSTKWNKLSRELSDGIMSEKKKGFELSKPHNMVLMKWPKGITPMQIKAVHLVTMQLKQWILNTDFEPDFSKGDSISAYEDIKTSFEMSVDDFAKAMNTTKRSLKAPVKDKNGDVVLNNGLPKLRIQDCFDQIEQIRCHVDNSRYITPSKGLQIVANPTYDKESDRVFLYTTPVVAAILQDDKFMNNFSMVDMQLQMSLNSVMASHILDRISRFKKETKLFDCTVKDLIEQCGIDVEIDSNGVVVAVRRDFIKVNITRPLKQIADKSDGMWELVGTGAKVTSKKRGKLLAHDIITFNVKYHDPFAEPPLVSVDSSKEIKTAAEIYKRIMNPSPDGSDKPSKDEIEFMMSYTKELGEAGLSVTDQDFLRHLILVQS